MNIVLLTTNLALGGAETQVALIAIELARRGHKVDVVSLIQPTAFQQELADAGVGLHAPGLARIPLVLRRLRPEILHCHMFHANLAGRLLRTLLPFPIVISTLHSTAESRRSAPDADASVRWRDLAYRLTDPLADLVTGVSAAVLDRHLESRAVSQGLVIPNGIDTHRFRPDPELRASTRAALGLAPGAFVWLAVGRLMWKKNFAALIHAFPHDPESVLLLAGAGPLESELREIIGHRPNVRLLGPRRDIPALMNAADAFVLSSVVEGLPVVLLEAAACELPCLATDVGGVRETDTGMVVDPDGLHHGLLAIRQMPPESRAKMGREARSVVVSRYSLEVVVEEWEALYRRCLSSM